MSLTISAPSTVLIERSPIVGAPVEAESAARMLSRLQQEVDTSHRHAWQSVTCLSYLRSVSVAKTSDLVSNRFLDGATQFSDDLYSASAALSEYAQAVERIHAVARDTEGEVEAQLGHILACSVELERAATDLGLGATGCVPDRWEEIPPLWPPSRSGVFDGATPSGVATQAWATANWTMQAMSWMRAADCLHECRSRWSTLVAERQEAERILISRIRQTRLGMIVGLSGDAHRVTITRAYTGDTVHPSRALADPRLADVLGGRLSPTQVAAVWQELGLSDSDVQRLPIDTIMALSKADGVPFRIQHLTSTKALEFSEQHPAEAHRLLGLGAEMSLSTFSAQIDGIRQGYANAEAQAQSLPGSPDAQLLGFGVHDGALTAAISIGDLDRASHVAVNVSGMYSNVADMGNALEGARSLSKEAWWADSAATSAIVTWIGYRSPNVFEVLSEGRATSGAAPLARFLDGIAATRTAEGTLPDKFTVLAHSYGSTTAAEALKIVDTRVDAFVTYGSAGVHEHTTVEQLHAAEVHSTLAQGDILARIGVLGSGRADPRHLAGVQEFSAENGTKPVTSHSMYKDAEKQGMFHLTDTGYLTDGTGTATAMGNIIAGVEK